MKSPREGYGAAKEWEGANNDYAVQSTKTNHNPPDKDNRVQVSNGTDQQEGRNNAGNLSSPIENEEVSDGLLAGINSLKEKRDGVSSQIKDETVARNKLREEIALLNEKL